MKRLLSKAAILFMILRQLGKKGVVGWRGGKKQRKTRKQ